MRVGDLIKTNHPSWMNRERTGLIVGEMPACRPTNKLFKVLWHDGTIGSNIWDYDLKVYNESR